jgi:16S rRNA (guanine(966)-N(2))-methyltransferase RsmD
MRVIAGTLGGRRIAAPRGSTTRPTPERVREALFSALGDLGGLRVLDLFAGSGALAIEALSRGAECAVLVESDRWAQATITANIDTLDLAAVAELRAGDALRVLAGVAEAGETYDLVFADPPYRNADKLGPLLSAAVPPVLEPGARVVCESDRRTPVELTGLPLSFERRYGDTLLRIYTHHES